MVLKENVTYILGAGFSAPVGIPVIKNFISKAHDLVAMNPERFGHFEGVFDRIDRLAAAARCYDVNIDNVEEVLSMLEMADYAGPTVEKAEFERFICDVVTAYTPQITSAGQTGPLTEWVFGGGKIGRDYGMFVQGLCGLKVQRAEGFKADVRFHEQAANYSVISLNYDRVLESSTEFLRDRWQFDPKDGFSVYPLKENETATGRVLLAKLHGSVDGGPNAIVLPTWNKGRYTHMLEAWRRAYEALAKANHIRIIGYSLPDNDAYFRYLLKAAATRSRNVKHIDVICWDEDGTVEQRYRSFVKSDKLTFKKMSTETYLARVVETAVQRDNSDPLVVNLEAAQNAAFNRLG